VLLAFFVLSVQLFITIIEFKLTVLAGFVLVPFALFGQTAFLAERVLGNVISSGIKLMVLAIVVGIGASIFGTLVRPTDEITLAQAASTILAAIAVFGLALFIPGLAAGWVSGAPQLGAGSAVATTAALGGTAVAGGLLAARPQPVTRINRKVVIGAAAVLLCLISFIVLLALKPPSLRIAGPQELFNVEHKPATDGLSKLPASYDGVKPEKKADAGKQSPTPPTLVVPPLKDPLTDAERMEIARLARMAGQAKESGVFFR